MRHSTTSLSFAKGNSNSNSSFDTTPLARQSGEKAARGRPPDLHELRPQFSNNNSVEMVFTQLDLDQAVHEGEEKLFVRNLIDTIAALPSPSVVGLEILVQKCPETVREEVLVLLAKNPQVQIACKSSAILADAIEKLRAQNTHDLAGKIAAAALEQIQQPLTTAMDLMLVKAEKGLSEKSIDLCKLIADLSSRIKEQTPKGRCVGTLMRNLVQHARDEESLFDFQGFLQALLHSVEPDRPMGCTGMGWIAGLSIATIETTDELERFVDAIAAVLEDKGMEGVQLKALHALASDVHHHVDWYWRNTLPPRFFSRLQYTLQRVIDTSEELTRGVWNVRLSEPFESKKVTISGSSGCAILDSKHYAAAVKAHFRAHSLRTRTPMRSLEFPDGYDGKRAGIEKRDKALRSLYKMLRNINPRRALIDLPGIKTMDVLVDGKYKIPALQIYYQPKFAEFLAYMLGDRTKYDERYYLGRCNQPFLDAADLVRDELSDLWKTVTENAVLNSNIPHASESVLDLSASRDVYASTINALFKRNFMIGEYHRSPAASNFILQNMKNLRKAGFTTCYVESLPIELQADVNAYLAGYTAMSVELELYSHALRYKEILAAAKKQGIRVICCDSGFARRDGSSPNAPFNYKLWSLIESDQKNRNGGKFFCHTGAAHAGDEGGTIGVARMIKDCKSVFIHQFDDSDAKATKFVLFSLDRRDELPKEHPCAKYFSMVDCDLYIASCNPVRISNDRDKSE